MRIETSPTGRRGGPSYEVDLRGRLLLRDLVDRLVHEEVAAYEERRRARLLARVLTPEEVDEAARHGRVDPGGRRVPPAGDPAAAVDVALEAFSDGLWFVFVDGEQVDDLDAELEVGDDTVLRFVRLVALAGG